MRNKDRLKAIASSSLQVLFSGGRADSYEQIGAHLAAIKKGFDKLYPVDDVEWNEVLMGIAALAPLLVNDPSKGVRW